MEQKFYICRHCGNIIMKLKDSGVPVVCCGEPMEELKAGTTDGALEKHVPVWKAEGGKVTVAVGICPISGGVVRDSYSIAGPLSRLVPVDVNVPGCPPRPQAIMEAVVLARSIWLKKLGLEG